MFDWDDLRVFLAVARTGRIASSARTLGMDATTIGRRLARLEKALDAELFEIANGERSLTGTGQQLFHHAEIAESATLAAMEEVTGQSSSLTGQVRLSVTEGLGTSLLAPRVAGFRRLHPGIRLDLITESGLLNPSKREADIAVMLARPQRGRLLVRRLADYRLHLYASTEYLKGEGVPETSSDLHRHALVGYVPEFIHSRELDYLDEIEAGLQVSLRSTSINVQYRMIVEGAGIGVLPDFMASHDPRLRLLLPEAEIVRSFWLVTHKDLRSLARIRAVAEWLDGCVAPLASTPPTNFSTTAAHTDQ